MSDGKADKRQSILDAAQSLLARYGFHGFSMKQLASEAGIAAGTVYLYFQDKEALIRELHRSVVAHLGQELEARLDATRPVPEQMRLAWWTLWEMSVSHPCRLMCKTQFDSLPPESHKLFAEAAEQELQPLFVLFQRARAQGLLKPLPDQALVSLFIEPCLALARKQVMGVLDLNEAALQEAASAAWDAIAQNMELPEPNPFRA